MIFINKNTQRKIDKNVDEISRKRDLGVKKYGIESDFFQEYLETYEGTFNVSTLKMVIIMNEFFDKWNIETRHKKLNRIINKIQ